MRYKVVDSNNNIIAVDEDTNFNYVCYNAEDDVVVLCKNKKIAFGAKIKGQVYSFGQEVKNYPIVSLIEVDILEYNYLKNLISNSSSGTDEIPEDSYEDSIAVNVDTSTIEFVRNKKIEEMSVACKSAITAGVEVTLSDGTYHFDLSTEDQLNINRLRYSLNAGEEYIAYHSKGELFRYYSRADIQKIIEATDNHILYHTSYFNSLKLYINSLTKIVNVENVYYGQDFPSKYKSTVFTSL